MAEFTPSDEAREALRSDLSHALEIWFGSHLYNWPDNPTRYFGQPASDAIDAFLRSKMLAEYRDHRITELEPFQVAHADLYRRYLAALAVIEKARDEIRFEEVHRILATVDTSALAVRDAEKVCPAVSPSDRACIGRAEWHEVHSDGIGTTWRDWAGKRPGIRVLAEGGENR